MVYPDREALFHKVIKADSIKKAGQDTLYYFYRTTVQGLTQNTHGACDYRYGGPSWMGPKALIRKDGYNIFFNMEGDSIKFNTLASAGESWTMYSPTDTAFFETSVDSVYQGKALETTDSIKALSIQYKDSSGTPLSHHLNDNTIKLSKHHGVIQTVPLRSFPNGHETNNIRGLTTPAMGIQNLTAKEVFDFSVGDTFHVEIEIVGPGIDTTYNEYKRKTVLDKYISSNEDTIIYRHARYRIIKKSVLGNLVSANIKKDTIRQKIVLSQRSYLNVWPGEIYINDDYYAPHINQYKVNFNGYSIAHNRGIDFDYKLRAKSRARMGSGYDSCYHHADYTSYHKKFYTEGLGIQQRTTYGLTTNNRLIVYFNKANKEWGHPIPFRKIKNQLPDDNNIINVYPNPTTGRFTIKFKKTTSGRIQIINAQGKQIIDKTINGLRWKQFTLNKKEIYFLRFYNKTKQEFETRRIVVVKEDT